MIDALTCLPTSPLVDARRAHTWTYFVECDDQLHRIFHLPLPTKASFGFDVFEASQWWIISRDFAKYLAANEPNTFVSQYLPYIEHVVVADENFFGTVLRNTEFCLTHVNRNYLQMEFDRWESDVPTAERDPRKCMMKDPNHCGRSPVTLKLSDAPILEISDNLFARKVCTPKPWSFSLLDSLLCYEVLSDSLFFLKSAVWQ